jgi:hypothetical protein
MATRIGITPDLETSKWTIEREYKNVRNWKFTKPFSTKKEAQDWELAKIEEMKVKSHSQTINTKLIRVEWRGFSFEHDGPR